MNSIPYPTLYTPTNGYVFVVTYGRSGSTLLMKLLNSIPGACIRGENSSVIAHLLMSINDLRYYDNINVRRSQIRQPPEDRMHDLRVILGTVDDPWYGAENIDVEEYARSVLDAFVRTVLCPPQQVSILGFKDISFYKVGDYFDSLMNCMLHFFPDSKIIFLTRDLDEVSNSGWWKDMDKHSVLQELEDANKKFNHFHKANAEKTIMFDYQEFFDNEFGVKRIFDFLGVGFDRDKVKQILDVRLDHLK